MPSFSVTIETDSGVKYGAGPLANCTSFRRTRRLDRAGSLSVSTPATDERAALLALRRYLRVHGVLAGTRAELGLGIIDSLAFDAQAQTIAVGGDDLLRELAYRTISFTPLTGSGQAPISVAEALATIFGVANAQIDPDWTYDASTYASQGATTSGSATVTSVTNIGNWLGRLGQRVYGAGIPAGATVVGAVVSSGTTGTITLSAAATATAAAVTLERVRVYHVYEGESVLAALVKLAELTGMHFRLGAGRQVVWLYNATPSSGVRAIQTGDPVAAESNANVCLITGLSVEQDSYALISLITPWGAGRMNLDGTDRAAPAGYTLDIPNNTMRRDAASTQYGYATKHEFFRDIGPAVDADDPNYAAALTNAKNMLFDAALEFLRRASYPQVAYRLQVTKLDAEILPGQTIRVVYRGFVDGYKWIDIDTDLIVLEATTEVTDQGVHTPALLVALVDRWPASDLDVLARAVQNASSGAGGGTVITGGGSGDIASAAPSPHDIGGAHHGGTLLDTQAPQFLKTDGARALTGNLAVGAGVTIDGIDLSAMSAGTLSSASGNSSGLAGAHTHAISASSAPGVAAELLKTDSGGLLTLAGLSVDGNLYVRASGATRHHLQLATDATQSYLNAYDTVGAAYKPLIISASQYAVRHGTINVLETTPTGNRVGIGRAPTTYKLEVAGDIWAASGWLRTSGATGWVNDTQGGGWYMADTTYVRVYGGKQIYAANTLYLDLPVGAIGNRIERNAARGAYGADVFALSYASTRALDAGILVNIAPGNTTLSAVQEWDGSAWTDRTARLTEFTSTQINFLPTTAHALYFGRSGASFTELYVNVSAPVAAGYTFVWEYWSGAAWTAFTPTYDQPGLVNDGWVYWSTLSGHAATTVNGVSAHWVRVSTTTTPSSVTAVTFINISAHTGWFLRAQSHTREKFRVDNLGQVYAAGRVHPGAGLDGSLVQSTYYLDQTATGIRVAGQLYTTGALAVRHAAPRASWDLDVLSALGVLVTDLDTNSSAKTARYGVKAYATPATDTPFVPLVLSAQSAANVLSLGGGTASGTAATQIDFYTAANNLTATGTLRARMASSGQLALGDNLTPAARLDIMDTGEQLRVRYDAASYASFTTSSAGQLTIGTTGATPATANLVLRPAGALTLHPAPAAATGDVLPNSNYRVNLGTINRKYLTLHAAELWVETLVAQNTIATIGGRVLVGPTTTLTRDFTTAISNYIYVKYNNLQVGDIVYLEANGKVEFLSIDSGPTLMAEGDYFYGVTRNLDGTGWSDWIKGDAVFNTGSPGQGFIDLYALNGITAPGLAGVFNFDPTPGTLSQNYADANVVTLFGDGAAEATGAMYFGQTGAAWSNLFFNIGIAGVYSGVTFAWQYWSGTAWTTFTPTITGGFSQAGYMAVQWSPSALTGWAEATLGGITAMWVACRITALTSWTSPPYQTRRRVVSNAATWGPTIAFNLRNSTTFNDWSEHAALGNLRGLYGYATDTFGVALGKYAPTGATYLTADATNGIRLINGGVAVGQWDMAGNITVGKTGGSADNVYISAAGDLLLRRGTTSQIELKTTGEIYVGERATGKHYLAITSGEIVFRYGDVGTYVETIKLTNTGNISLTGVLDIGTGGALRSGVTSFTANGTGFYLSAASNSAMRLGTYVAGVFTKGLLWDGTDLTVSGNIFATGGKFTGVVGIGSAGELRQGSGVLGSTFTGHRIWNDSGIGRLAGYNNNVIQWEGAVDGKLKAGGGNVVLDADGIKLTAGNGAPNIIRFSDGVGYVGNIFWFGSLWLDSEGTSISITSDVSGAANEAVSFQMTNGSSGPNRLEVRPNYLWIANSSTPPPSGSGNAPTPVGGGYLFAAGGAGKWKGSSGTVTTFGPAEPHCPACGRDFALEWENEAYGKLTLCMWCLTDGMTKGIITKEAA